MLSKINIPPKAKINSATIEKKGMSKFITAKLDELIIFSLNCFTSLLLESRSTLRCIKFLTKATSSCNFLEKTSRYAYFLNEKITKVLNNTRKKDIKIDRIKFPSKLSEVILLNIKEIVIMIKISNTLAKEYAIIESFIE